MKSRDDIADRTFPWMSNNIENATIAECVAGCSKFGYEAGGLEYGYQCCKLAKISILVASITNQLAVCGDVPLGAKATLQPETDCNVACPGDPQILCGMLPCGYDIVLFHLLTLFRRW